ncbi:MAG: 4-hydroxyphenylpyruvate dioxygenase [Bacteriovoracaceae bacterium]|jgi:4-hydroxyphenylpyruvate dioxygenase
MTRSINEGNPLGILAIDHLEFTCDSLKSPTKELFYKLGFQKTFENSLLKTELFTQGQCRFLLNANTDEKSWSRFYFNNHGEGVSKISFLVEDAKHALKTAVERGGEMVNDIEEVECEHGVFITGTIKGFGDVLNEFVERPKAYFRPEYNKLESDPQGAPLKQRCARIDHLTNNVPHGEMEKWVKFYEDVYGFKVTRYFDIHGAKTGLDSKVVQLPKGEVIIPINEPDVPDGKSQIQEFLDRHKGAGVQHIALTSGDIVETISELRSRDIRFLNTPSTYYEGIAGRGIKVTEDLAVLEENQILVDGDEKGYLLQIFSDTYVGPLFFEFIQRKNNDGFGEGNFQALFDSIELDQMKRGYLKDE